MNIAILARLPTVVRSWVTGRLRPPQRILVAALLGFAAVPAHALDPALLTPVEYHYRLSRGGAVIGDGVIALRDGDSTGCYLYSQTAEPSALWLRMLSSEVVEQSWFCIRDGRLQPTAFRYHRNGIGASAENFSLNFDWSQRRVVNERGEGLAITDTTVDRLLMQLILRDWVLAAVNTSGKPPQGEKTVSFAEKNKLREYRFAVQGEEELSVPAGSFSTIRLDRVDSKRNRSRFWLAPALDYAVVKAEQQRDDDPMISLVLQTRPQPPRH